MGCSASSEIKDDLGKPYEFDPDFNGPLKKRSCTDLPCLIVFLAFIGCWIGLALYAFRNGDPNTLLIPKDSSGSRCGLDEHVKDKPYLFFFDLTKCLDPSVPFVGCKTKQVCVKECPKEYFYFGKTSWDTSKLLCDYDVKGSQEAVNNGSCAKWYFESTSFEHRCIPKLNLDIIEQYQKDINMNVKEVEKAIKNLKVFAKAEQVGLNIVDDLIKSWWKILIGVAFATVTCLIYILLMKWVAALMVWISIIGVILLLSASIYISTVKYIDCKNTVVAEEDSSTVYESYLTKKETWLILLIISSVLLGIILLTLIFLRSRINLAIALVKEGSKAVGSVTSVLLFPIFPWILHIGIIVFAIAVGLYLSTCGYPIYKVRNMNSICQRVCNVNDKCLPSKFQMECANKPECIDVQCKFITMDTPVFYPYLQVFNVFGFLWFFVFTTDLGQIILASVFATWYWTFNKTNLPFFAVTEATFRVLRFHLGTIAFGSLIIAICKFIRLILEYIDRNLKKYDNPVTRAILCCMKCFFWCLEKFLKFINRNAYIMCAIHGKNFCASARDAFSLLLRNIVRVFVLDKVTSFLFFLGKILITIGVGAVAYVIFATNLTSIENDDIKYPLVPVITIMIVSYLIAEMFFSVYTVAIDTLFLCFLEDCERNNGSSDKPYFMSKNLMKILGKKNKNL